MKAYQAQIATAGMAHTQQPVGTVGGGGASAMMGGANMMRTVGGSMTNAAVGSGAAASVVGMTSAGAGGGGGQFPHQSQAVFPGHIQPGVMHYPYLHPQIKQMPAQQFHHPSMHAATEQQVHQQLAMMGNPPQGFPPHHPGSAHFQQPRNVQSQQQQHPAQQAQQVQSSAPDPLAPPQNTSFPGNQPGPLMHFPQAFPTAHPLSQQTPQHFPQALPSAVSHQALIQHFSGGGRADVGAAAVQGRMMSQAVGATGAGVGPVGSAAPSSGPQGNSAFTYGGKFCIIEELQCHNIIIEAVPITCTCMLLWISSVCWSPQPTRTATAAAEGDQPAASTDISAGVCVCVCVCLGSDTVFA